MSRLPLEYAIRNLGRSPGRLFMSVAGSMIVVLLVVAAGGFVNGMDRALRTSGSPRNAILLGIGSEESVERSEIPMRAPGIAAASIASITNRAGIAAVSPEIHAALPVRVGDAIDEVNTVLRGVRPEAFLVHDEVVVLAGRAPERGADEVALGRLTARSLGFEPIDAAIGATLQIDDRPFTVVGLLGAGGGVIEGELWMPLSDLLVVAQRDTLSCVVLRLDEENLARATSQVQAFAATRLDLELTMLPESDYYGTLAAFHRPIRWMVLATAVLIAAGGVVGGLNATYAAFAGRIREIGTLRTLGYGRLAILRSLAIESTLTAAAGGVIAAIIARTTLDGVAIRFSMGVFGIDIGPRELATGLATGLALGLLGALLPGWRCLQKPIPEALRSH